MSETTHDLTQRADTLERNLRRLDYSDEADLVRDLSAALVQAEQEKDRYKAAGVEMRTQLAENEAWIASLTTDGGKVWGLMLRGDIATPVAFQQTEARLAIQEATIRQVEQDVRFVVEHGGVEPGDPYGVDLGLSEAMKERLWRAADTLLAILPAEQTKVTP